MKPIDGDQENNSQHSKQAFIRTIETTPEHQSALLAEYEIAQQNVWKWDNATWQTAAIFLSASLAGFIVVTQTPDSSPYKPVIVFILGLSSILVLLGWFAIIQRWDASKRVVFFRLREIEQELGMWKNRYLEHLTLIKILKSPGLRVISDDDKGRLQRLEQAFPKYPGISVTLLIKIIVAGIIIGWTSLVIFEVIFLFVR